MKDLKLVYDLLEENKLLMWIFGGWAEELRRTISPRTHKDIDLLYPANDFSILDEFIEDNKFPTIKKFPHKRAFLFNKIVVEVFLVQQTGRTSSTNFFSLYKYDWPLNTFDYQTVDGFRVASSNTLKQYRNDHKLIENVSNKFIAKNL